MREMMQQQVTQWAGMRIDAFCLQSGFNFSLIFFPRNLRENDSR
jgi:hypothetical protein